MKLLKPGFLQIFPTSTLHKEDVPTSFTRPFSLSPTSGSGVPGKRAVNVADKSHFSRKASSRYCSLACSQPRFCTDTAPVLRPCPTMKMVVVLDSSVYKQV